MAVRIEDAKKILGERATELTAELAELRTAVAAAADGSSKQAVALISWTRWYVIATFLLVAVTVFQTLWRR